MEELLDKTDENTPSKEARLSLPTRLLVAVLVVVVPAYAGMGSFNHWMMAGMFIALSVLPFFFGWLRRDEPPINRSFGYAAELSMLAMVLAVVGCLLGGQIYEWEIAKAKAAPDQLVYALERFRAEHGFYPDSLSRLPLGLWESPPRLLSYHSYGKSFGFEIKDPHNPFGGWTYDMQSHDWETAID